MHWRGSRDRAVYYFRPESNISFNLFMSRFSGDITLTNSVDPDQTAPFALKNLNPYHLMSKLAQYNFRFNQPKTFDRYEAR